MCEHRLVLIPSIICHFMCFKDILFETVEMVKTFTKYFFYKRIFESFGIPIYLLQITLDALNIFFRKVPK